MVETERAAAFVMDDILLYGFVAGAKAPGDYVVSADPLLIEPYAIMLRRDDPAFKKVAERHLDRPVQERRDPCALRQVVHPSRSRPRASISTCR